MIIRHFIILNFNSKKSVVLDPDAQFSVERTLTQQDVDRLIDICTSRLTEQDSPRLDTIKMQVWIILLRF